MDKKKLKILGKQRDDLISTLYASYDKELTRAQTVLFNEFSKEILDKLEFDGDGKVINNARNRNVLVSIDKFFQKFNAETNPKILTTILDGVQQIMSFNHGYYEKFNAAPKAELIKLKDKALNQIKGWLGIEDGEAKENGYLGTLIKNDTVKTGIVNATMKTIYAQDGWQTLKKTMQEMIEGDDSLGAFQKYHRNYAYDLYSQIDRATGKTYADELKFEFAIYEGGLIETSRQFCVEHNGNVYHISEILKMKPEKAIPANYNPLFDMGGFGCRHHWNWIPTSLALILRPDARKFVEPKKEGEETKKEAQKPPKKIIDVEAVEKTQKRKK